MKSIRTGAALTALAFLLSSCAAGGEPTGGAATAGASTAADEASAAPEETVPATISVSGITGLGPGASIPNLPAEGECRGHTQYTDIQEGLQIEILDASGTVVALTALGPGALQESNDCLWLFAAEVPAGGSFYRARMGSWESDLVPENELGASRLVIDPTK